MASITGTVTIAGDPDDWIAVAWDADTHAYAGVAAVSGGAYEITGLTAGKAYVVGCRPQTGPVWKNSTVYAVGDYSIPTNPIDDPYIFKATAIEGDQGDDNFSSVVLLVPLNGDNGSTTFTDIKAHSISRGGNVVISTAQSLYYPSSAYFDGTGDYLQVADSSDFDLPGNFTAECWFYGSSFTSTKALFTLNGANLVYFGINASGKPFAYIGESGGNINGTTTVSDNTWHHIALVRSSGSIKLYFNGVNEGATISASGTVQPSATIIGAYNTGADYPFSGYISDVRLTKGVARYTSNFSVPTNHFPTNQVIPSGSTEPTWPTTPGNTVVDGGVTWTNMGQLLDPLIAGPLIAV